MTENKVTIAGVVVAIVIALLAVGIAISNKAPTASFAGVINYDELDATAIKIGGSSGSRVGPVIASTCSLISANYTNLAASTSLPMDCAVTGVVSGDLVFAQFATSSPLGEGWLVAQSSASSTSGFITLRIVNNTGAAATIPASIASTTQFIVLHPRSTVPGL